MPLFPMFVDLENETVLIIGTGKHAADKAAKLAPFGAKLRQITPEAFTPELLSPAPALVILAQPGHPDNGRIAEACRQARIPINVVDDPGLCTVRFPSLVTRGELSIGIATNGRSPVASALIRERIEQMLPDGTEELLLWAGEQTAALRREIPDYAQRTVLLRKILTRAFDLGRPLTEEECSQL